MSHHQKLVKTPGGYCWINADDYVVCGEPMVVRIKSSYGEGKPLKSRALSVHPDQAEHFNETAHKQGIHGVHYDSKGTCWITSRHSRNELMKRRGTFDMDASYGDYAGG